MNITVLPFFFDDSLNLDSTDPDFNPSGKFYVDEFDLAAKSITGRFYVNLVSGGDQLDKIIFKNRTIPVNAILHLTTISVKNSSNFTHNLFIKSHS